MLRHTPLWRDRFSGKRTAFPSWRGDAEVDVVVVGAGLTGCACAWAIGAAGRRVVLLEADRIGVGATAAASGIAREDFDAPFQDAARAHGLRAARTLWQGQRRAALDLAAALRRRGIRCDLDPVDLLTVGTDRSEAARAFRREYDARREAGLEVTWMTPAAVTRATRLESAGAIKSHGFVLDPFRACLGLASAAVAAGRTQIFERSPVSRVRDRRKFVEVQTDRGTLRADSVIVATAARLVDLRSLRRHLKAHHSYTVVTEPLPAAVRREVGARAAVIEDAASPSHIVRWLADDRVMVSGGDQPAVVSQSQAHAIEQRTGQLMYELSVLYPAISGLQAEWSWTAEYDRTPDGLPCLGPHRNFPRHFFALGHGRHGHATSWLAARLAARWVLGAPDKGDELFGFARIL